MEISFMNEVEGSPISSRKRKTGDDCGSSSKSKMPRVADSEEEVVALKYVGGYEFSLDSEGYVIVYTDGSCLGNGRKDACAGFGVYFRDNHPL